MSDSSEDEDLSRFKEAVDSSFTKLIDQSRSNIKNESKEKGIENKKSERYLEVASHYNDVKVPDEMQKKIGAKISAIISKNVQFVDVSTNGIKKRKVKGGVLLFKDSSDYLSCEEPKDTYTDRHNAEARKKEKKKKKIAGEVEEMNENDKICAVSVSGEYVMSKEETKCWKSRRKEKIFKYKSHGQCKLLTSVE